MQKISLGVKLRPLGRNFCMLKMRSSETASFETSSFMAR